MEETHKEQSVFGNSVVCFFFFFFFFFWGGGGSVERMCLLSLRCTCRQGSEESHVLNSLPVRYTVDRLSFALARSGPL